MSYKCANCAKSFTRSYNLNRHLRESCAERFNIDESEKRRRMDGSASSGASTSSSSPMKMCHVCNVAVPENNMLGHQRTLQHRNNLCLPLSHGVQVMRTAFKNRILSYRINSDNEHIDYQIFFDDIKPKVMYLLSEMLRIQQSLKVNMVVVGRYLLPSQETYSDKSFNTTNTVITAASDLDDVYQTFVEAMKTQSTDFQEKDSGMYN